MKHLVIIIFLIASLYSYEVNCLNMFAVIFDKNTTDDNTAKCIEYYIDELGCDANIVPSFTNDGSNLLDAAYENNKTKTFDLLLNKDITPDKWLTAIIATEFLVFFRENSDGIKDKKASPELLEFIKTPKYKEFKEEKFKLIKKLLDHGQDPYYYGYLRVILKIVGDEKDLDKLLESEKR
ncbi:hypothetical protein CCON33237_0092 [Campylobacter concisus]|uniref:Uncharacterized protein n=2 Tax=Campylobacter concisus TaxID=199 RepID=A0A0M3V1V4_9BACT|nr:hypothetical protein CCON33237_0092 [Campylobacter concisus]